MYFIFTLYSLVFPLQLQSQLSDLYKNWSRHIKLDLTFCDERISTTRNRLTDAECHVRQCDSYLVETRHYCQQQRQFIDSEFTWVCRLLNSTNYILNCLFSLSITLFVVI